MKSEKIILVLVVLVAAVLIVGGIFKEDIENGLEDWDRLQSYQDKRDKIKGKTFYLNGRINSI